LTDGKSSSVEDPGRARGLTRLNACKRRCFGLRLGSIREQARRRSS
jgi:hypothetical protein